MWSTSAVLFVTHISCFGISFRGSCIEKPGFNRPLSVAVSKNTFVGTPSTTYLYLAETWPRLAFTAVDRSHHLSRHWEKSWPTGSSFFCSDWITPFQYFTQLRSTNSSLSHKVLLTNWSPSPTLPGQKTLGKGFSILLEGSWFFKIWRNTSWKDW